MLVMVESAPPLSKSKLIAAWQCPRRLHMQKHHADLGQISAQTQSMWAAGHRVGRIAQQLYGGPDSREVDFDRRIERMIGRTQELINAAAKATIFEATFKHENVLVRVDVLIPDRTGWRIVEVKASTQVKDYHLLDCAIQDWVLRGAGIEVTRVSLACIDNSFVYPGDGHYDGLLFETDLTERVRRLEPAVAELLDTARGALGPRLPEVMVGLRCSKPYDCEFLDYCWPTDTQYPIHGLRGAKDVLGKFVALGRRDIRDVGRAELTTDLQRRIHRVTSGGEPEVLDAAGETFRGLPYPRYYLDFETVSPAVPLWADTRPYARLPFQWSLHIENAPDSNAGRGIGHGEFLDLSGAPPMRPLALALIECLGSDGPVLTYTHYEKSVIEGLIAALPELEVPLNKIIGRLFDMHPIVKANYYHPRMLGSWSIKDVMPTINPKFDYARLEGIKDGSAAADGYLEAIDPQTPPARKSELDAQLRRYCRFDTEAMVEIVRYFSTHKSE